MSDGDRYGNQRIVEGGTSGSHVLKQMNKKLQQENKCLRDAITNWFECADKHEVMCWCGRTQAKQALEGGKSDVRD